MQHYLTVTSPAQYTSHCIFNMSTVIIVSDELDCKYSARTIWERESRQWGAIMSLQCDGEKREVTGMEVTHIVGAGIMGNCEGDKKTCRAKVGGEKERKEI